MTVSSSTPGPSIVGGIEFQNTVAQDTVLIVNGRARNGQEWFDQTQVCLREKGVTVGAAHLVEDPSRLPDLVRDCVGQGVKRLLVGGGDGTFRSIASALVHQDVILGVLPLGTVNDLARNLGIKAEVEAACEVIARGAVSHITVGQANDDYFLITCSLGFSAQSQRALSPGLKKALGPFGYMAAGLVALKNLRDLQVTMRCTERNETLNVLQVGVINGHSWMGGAVEIPGLTLERNKLAFYAVPSQPFLSCLRLAKCLHYGEFFSTPGLISFLTEEVTLETRAPQPLVLDGDLCGHTPVRLRRLPDAIQVFANDAAAS